MSERKNCPTCGEDEPFSGTCGTSTDDTRALCRNTVHDRPVAQWQYFSKGIWSRWMNMDENDLEQARKEGFEVRALYTAPDALQAEVERLKHFEAAYKEWSDKTDWVQESAEVRELGKHRADVMRERIERLQEEKDSAIRILARQIDKFRAALIERDAFKADAERYQYLKYILDDSPYYIQILEHTEGDLLDEAIDNSRRDHPDFKPEVDHE